MKKITFAILSTLLLSLCVYAAGDRLDFFKNDQTFFSVLVDDIEEMSYLPNADKTGYDKVNVEYRNGENLQVDLSSLSYIRYSAATHDYLEITRVGDDHSRVSMLDCINNDGIIDPSKDGDYTAQSYGGLVHFVYRCDLGWDAVHIVTGKYTGKVYTDIPGYVWLLPKEHDDNYFGQDCWTFIMPNEPVEIKSVSTERTTYNGQEFLGTYKGYPIAVTESRLIKSSDPQFEITFNGNETYKLKTTDSHAFDFIDLYHYNFDNKSFKYQEIEKERLDYQEHDTYGAAGQFYGSDILIDVNNRTEDTPENVVRYFASKADVNYVCAARDEYGFQYLIEIANPALGTTKWFFLNNYGYEKKEATLDFISGTSIGAASEAKVTYDQEVQFKYVLTEGGYPQFIAKGQEAGTYTATDGNPTLVLDGFGEMKFGDTVCSYKIEGATVTAVINGQTRTFVLNIENKTYSEVREEAWDGAVEYINEATLGAPYNNSAETQRNKVKISFDHNLIGAEKPGYVAISIELYNSPSYRWGVSDCQRYTYDKQAKTVTVSNVLVGNASGGSARKNIVFTVSDDMTKLYLAGEGEATKIYGTSSGYVYLDYNNAAVGEVATPEPEPEPVELAPKYVGKAVMDMMGSQGEVDVTLSIDADENGAEKLGYATLVATGMDTDIIKGCVEYVAEGTTLTLKGMTVGDGNYGIKSADIVFNIAEDGTLVGTAGDYYGADGMTAFIKVIFEGAVLTPEAGGEEPEPEPIQLAPKYVGKAVMDMYGSQGEVDVTLSIDADENGAAKPGYATLVATGMDTDIIKGCVEYVAEGTTLTLKGMTVGNGSYGTKSADIVFNIAEDGTLVGTAGDYYGTGGMTAAIKVIFEGAVLSPEGASEEPEHVLADNYAGTATMEYYGMPGDVTVTLAIDADKSGAEKPGYATLVVNGMGTDIIASCVEYAVEGTTFTLKGVTVGNGYGSTTTVDIVFNIAEDGTLVGTAGEYYGTTMATAAIMVVLDGAVLAPVEE